MIRADKHEECWPEAGYGVAVGPSDDIYLDIDESVLSSAGGILEVRPAGHVTALWRSWASRSSREEQVSRLCAEVDEHDRWTREVP